jgi:glycosyltransferase involved in cell wall biosynthesis
VVIPLYNKVRHVQRALDSVVAQTFGGFEVIVVNDGSTDGSDKVVERYADSRIRLFHQENAGVSAARNRGIAEAKGELVAFLDADDEWLPGFLSTVLRLYERFPGCGAYAMGRRIVEMDGYSWSFSYVTIPAPPWEGIIPNYFRTVVLDPDPFNTSQTVVPRHVFDRVGLFPVGVSRGEDTDMWCRIALRFPIALSTQIGGVYHRDAENRASAGPLPRNHRVIESLDRALETGTLPAGVTVDDILEYRNKLHIACARNCMLEGFPEEAREHLRAAASTVRLRRARRYWLVRSFVPRLLEKWARGVERFIDKRARS